MHGHGAGADLLLQRLVGPEQELLARLAARVERPLDLHAAERARLEQAAVVAGEWHPLGDALVDDVDADLGQPVGVGLAGAEVATLHRVLEEAKNAVAVVAVVLGGVDAALGGDGVRAARGVVKREAVDVVALLPSVAAAAAPARPEPTIRMVCFRRLAGFTSFISKRQRSHFCSIGPDGTLASSTICSIRGPS